MAVGARSEHYSTIRLPVYRLKITEKYYLSIRQPYVTLKRGVAKTERRLRQLVEEFGRVCKRRKLKVNESKSKVLKCMRLVGGRRMNVALNGDVLEEVECFKYLGSRVAVGGGIEGKVKFRMNDVGKVCGGMKRVFKCKSLGMSAKRRLYESTVLRYVGLRLGIWEQQRGD